MRLHEASLSRVLHMQQRILYLLGGIASIRGAVRMLKTPSEMTGDGTYLGKRRKLRPLALGLNCMELLGQ